MSSNNIGGYDSNYIYDRRAVNYLEGVLLKSELLIPHVNCEDKIPNLDGYIEICEQVENKANPIGKFEIQVKSLNHDYRNGNKILQKNYSYKYSCDTKAMNVVLNGVTYNPVLLILVDCEKKRIFWKILSFNYCVKLNIGSNKNKTIYFDDSDEIQDLDKWYETLVRIYKKADYERQHEMDNMFLCEKDRKIPIEVQDLSDYLNGLLDRELWFIKEAFFPDVWKIGIAYIESGENGFSCVGLYEIIKGKNDLVVKRFREDGKYFCRIEYGGSYRLKDIIQEMLEKWVNDFFKWDTAPVRYWPDIVLAEVVFEHIDRILSIQEMQDTTKEHYILGWNANTICYDEIEEIVNHYEEQNWKTEKSFMELVCRELHRRGMKEVRRPWKKLVHYHISSRDEHCITFEEDENRETIDNINMEQFVRGFYDFYLENKKGFGERSQLVFQLRGAYTIILDDNMEGYRFAVKEEPPFSIEVFCKSDCLDIEENVWDWLSMNEEIYSFGGSGLMCRNDYSWEKIWRVFNRNIFLQYIGVNQERNPLDGYFASM